MGKKIKRFVVVAAIFFAAVALYSQTNQMNAQNPELSKSLENLDGSSRIDESKISLTESSILMDGNTANQMNYSSTSSGWFYVRMILVLVLVVAAIYFVMRFFKNKANPVAEDSDFLRRVASLNIAPGRSVEIVTLLDSKGYVLGVTESNINLIAEIGNTAEEKELISAMNLTADKNQKNKKPANFADVLEMFVGKGKSTNKKTSGKNDFSNIYYDTEKKVDDFLKNSSSDE